MSRSEEERFVEAWIAENVGASGYDADDDHAERLAGRLVSDAPFDRAAIEAQIGDLTARMKRAIEAATEGEMMSRDGRIGYSGVEKPVDADGQPSSRSSRSSPSTRP